MEDPGRDESNLPAPRAPDRLEALGYSPLRKKPLVLKELTPKMKLLASYMVGGCDAPIVRKLTRPVQEVDPKSGEIVTAHKPIEPGQPLTLIEAAGLLRIRRRQARDLMRQPLFANHLSQEIAGLRNGEKAASVHRMIALRDDPGGGRAADRKIQLAAAQAILGEGDHNTPSVNANNIPVSPGYVLDLRPSDGETIDGELAAGPPSAEP